MLKNAEIQYLNLDKLLMNLARLISFDLEGIGPIKYRDEKILIITKSQFGIELQNSKFWNLNTVLLKNNSLKIPSPCLQFYDILI